MKPINLRSTVLVLCVTGSVLLCGFAATAADSPQAAAAAQFSAVHGFKDAALPQLRRAASTDTGVATGLIQQLCPAPCSTPSDAIEGGKRRLESDGWSLQIAVDGFWARFQDLEVSKRAHSLAKDPSQKMSADALEKAGRAFIAAKLDSAIILTADEQLVPIRTDYRFEGGQDVNTGEATTSIVANRIVFGRTIGGVPVVGGGSAVVITFANDGSVESFQYDWPAYEVMKQQNVISASEVLGRVQTVMAARGISTPTISPMVSDTGKAPYPIALSADTTLVKLECGYYDPGARVPAANSQVQPGCAYHAVYQSANGMRQGLAGAVPAGVQFDPDAAWPESLVLTSR
jgi:hypothetical protein